MSPLALVALLAAASAVIRFAVALRVQTPVYYPDEFIHA
jgi:hypothetical protein